MEKPGQVERARARAVDEERRLLGLAERVPPSLVDRQRRFLLLLRRCLLMLVNFIEGEYPDDCKRER